MPANLVFIAVHFVISKCTLSSTHLREILTKNLLSVYQQPPSFVGSTTFLYAHLIDFIPKALIPGMAYRIIMIHVYRSPYHHCESPLPKDSVNLDYRLILIYLLWMDWSRRSWFQDSYPLQSPRSFQSRNPDVRLSSLNSVDDKVSRDLWSCQNNRSR